MLYYVYSTSSFFFLYQVIGLQGGALLGVAYKMPRRTSTVNLGLSAAATGSSGTFEDSTVTPTKVTEAPSNFQLYRYNPHDIQLMIMLRNMFNVFCFYSVHSTVDASFLFICLISFVSAVC